MKTEKGVTLVMLAITIVILGILTAITIKVGSDEYKDFELQAYVTKMNMVQARVNLISQDIQNGDTSYNNIGEEIGTLSQDLQAMVDTALGNTPRTGFKYYDIDALKQLGLDKMDEDVLINFSTRQIFSVLEIEYEGETYYNQYKLPNGIRIQEYGGISTIAPDFTLVKDNYGLTAKVNVTNIVYDSQINGGDIYYAEVTDNTTNPVTVDYWRQVQGTSFDVTKTAEYAVKVIDKNNGETIKTTKVVTCNSPEIVTGMIPVIYDTTLSAWKRVDDSDIGKWYDYAEKKWANVMLSDGLVVDQDGVVTTMGSMFVWIPRYAYSITSGYGQGGANATGTINIKFLKENTSLTTDEKTTRISNTPGQGNWIIHPVFTDGSKNNYSEGGWDRELNGFWVAKFEASGLTSGNTGTAVGNANASSSTPVATTENTIVKVLPNVISWRDITIGESQYNSMQMCINAAYGWRTGSVDSHLIKNDEWGAVAYLCYSQYGEVPWNNGCGLQNGYYYDLYTGQGPGSLTSEANYGGKTENRQYDTDLGVLASTTGNVYGVYDMARGANERVAAYLNNKNDYIGTNGNTLNTTYFTNNELKPEYAKYWNRYEVGAEEKNNAIVIDSSETLTQDELWVETSSGTKYNEARQRITTASWNNMATCKGIGINEVAGGFSYWGLENNRMFWVPTANSNLSWNSDIMLFGHAKRAFVQRSGGLDWQEKETGILCISFDYGNENNQSGFRPALVIEM